LLWLLELTLECQEIKFHRNESSTGIETIEKERSQATETASDKELNQKLTILEITLEQTLDAVQTFGPTAEKKTIESTADEMSSVSPELAQKLAERVKAAAEMGDVMLIKCNFFLCCIT
jgi:hypothetical protein